MSVIPGLLLIGEGHRVGYLFIPFFRSLWALYSSAVVQSLCFSPFALPRSLSQAVGKRK